MLDVVCERVKDGSKFWPEQLERWRKVLFMKMWKTTRGANGRRDKVKDPEFGLGQVQFEMPIKYVI